MSNRENTQDNWEQFQNELKTLESIVEELFDLDTDDNDDVTLATVLNSYNVLLRTTIDDIKKKGGKQ